MTTATKEAVPAIYAAIASIQEGVGKIPKNGEMKDKMGKVQYTYVRNDDILTAVQELLVKEGVIVSPAVVNHDVQLHEIGTRLYTTVRLDLEQTYISIKDGSTHTVTAVGEAAGYDDKGTRKAITQAQKIANLLTFSIATGEEDADSIKPEDSLKDAPVKPAAEVVATNATQDLAIIKGEVQKLAKAQGITTIVKLREYGDNFFNVDKDNPADPKAKWLTTIPALEKLKKHLESGEVA